MTTETCLLLTGVFAVSLAITVAAPLAAKAGAPMAREAVDDKYKWHPEDLFADDAAWEAAFTQLEAEVDDIAAYKGRLAESPATLLAAIQTMESFAQRAEHVYQYAHIKNDEDTRVNHYQGMLSRIFSLWMQFEQQAAFLRPEILAIDEARMAELSADPELAGYAFFLDDITRMRPYTLDADTEALIAATGEMANGPGEIFDLFTNADLKFPTIDIDGEPTVVNNTTWYQMRSHPDRELRKQAMDAFYGTYHDYRNTLAVTYGTHVKADMFGSRTRGFDNTLHASLYPNNIPVEVYTNLIDTVNANLEPLHRYVALKKRVLGLDEFRSHDVYAPLVTDVEKQDYSYEQAVAMVLDAVKPLGKQYGADLEAGFDAGWVDVYETEGKKSGAYSSTVYAMHPFVLMNYKGELEDVSTLAHEMGHAMHGYYSNENQPYIYYDHTIFVAEVASTTNEVLMIRKMIDEAKDPQLKLYLLDFWANQIINTVYRQTYFAEFEMKAHAMAENGEALTADAMTELYHDIFQTYYGPELVFDGHLDMTWARIPHFYRSFYVYQYATSYSASLSLAKGLTRGNKRQRLERQKAYLGFLGAGKSKYSIDILRDAGVDMATPQPIQDCMETFEWLVSEMEKLTSL